jgi:hypothetical protein
MFKILLINLLEEIVTEMEEIIWIGIKDKLVLSIKMCVGFLY